MTSSKWTITIPSRRRDADVCAEPGDDVDVSNTRLLSNCSVRPKQAKHEKHPGPKTSSAAVVSDDLLMTSFGRSDSFPACQEPGESTPGEHTSFSFGEAKLRYWEAGGEAPLREGDAGALPGLLTPLSAGDRGERGKRASWDVSSLSPVLLVCSD